MVFVKKNAMLKCIFSITILLKVVRFVFPLLPDLSKNPGWKSQAMEGSKSRIPSETSGKPLRVGVLGALQMKSPELSENISRPCREVRRDFCKQDPPNNRKLLLLLLSVTWQSCPWYHHIPGSLGWLSWKHLSSWTPVSQSHSQHTYPVGATLNFSKYSKPHLEVIVGFSLFFLLPQEPKCSIMLQIGSSSFSRV